MSGGLAKACGLGKMYSVAENISYFTVTHSSKSSTGAVNPVITAKYVYWTNPLYCSFFHNERHFSIPRFYTYIHALKGTSSSKKKP